MSFPDLPRQTGGVGMKEALFPSVASVQVATAFPISSNPVLQEYVAVSPTELPAEVTAPLLGLLALEHSAEKRQGNICSMVISTMTTYDDK